MTGTFLDLVGTLLVWIGYGFALRALFLGLRLLRADPGLDRAATGRWAGICTVVAAITLAAGSYITGRDSGWHIPLVWVIMPFAGWAFALSLAMIVARLSQASSALSPLERRAKYQAAAVWFAALILFAFWYRSDNEAKVAIVKGTIPLSLQTAVVLISLAVIACIAMVFTARAAKARGVAKGFVTYLTLIVGSILFGLPLVWLVVTSFKEDVDMASPNGIVWIPRVHETVPYLDPKHPAYETVFQGTTVRGRIIEQHPDGSVKLDINRPMSMRGMTADTSLNRLQEVPVDADLVTATMDGQQVQGMVVEEMEDGHKRVQALSPPGLKGREQIYAPSDVQNVRKIGLRYQNYSEALDYLPKEANHGLTYLQNTLLIVVLGLAGTILSSAIVAYAFSRMRFPGRDLLFTLMLATMMLPGAVTKLPQFMIFKQLGWIDTLLPLWVPAFFGSAFNIFMLRQFFRQIPMELEDAAKIDGASYLRTFWSVMMPLIKPAIAVIAILTFVGAWNNFLDPLIYINSPEHMTISYAVQLYASDRSDEPGLLTAFTTMSMVPVLALFFFCQKYFIEGVTLTGLGGR